MKSGTKKQPKDLAEDALSVSQVTARVKDHLESRFTDVWITGEVTNLVTAGSGHIYLGLKDETALLRSVIWRGTRGSLAIEPTDGMEVVCHGRIEVYPPRGSYQLTIDRCHALGTGTLETKLRELHARLENEGLFSIERKQNLPQYPRRIGLITSTSGAAVSDFLKTLVSRWPIADVVLFPSRVQGAGAAEELASSLLKAGQLTPPLDVVAIVRGGGSLEDLWSFNEEILVRAVAESKIPIISGIGHEIDISLVDLVADMRGLTPTDAAIHIAVERQQILDHLWLSGKRLNKELIQRVTSTRHRLNRIATARPLAFPHHNINAARQHLLEKALRLQRQGSQKLKQSKDQLTSLAALLEANSPLKLLSKGYSVTTNAKTKEAIDSWRQAPPGTTIITKLAHGELHSRVERSINTNHHKPNEHVE
ncbi:MAG: exodeoxyribonuclease VII large subunit [Planctomycetaceae bacterium]|nr:exodeoxyribonuclease VII large subunit [Planctomycetaceae bacterium]MBT4887484.1 exodeoxyribonuclease VII large subunit [Planctomycetaceae bacterium]MBT6642617.1 exodeoxyribonuclease VII large subunit [Planctomycetaceae bacterium]MBT6920161.1 exodeoxyribonuclease VII large subunit [Planctomycetaceae bacterium]MBT7728445.1 exodeoxyribonuclease VII large subunit [Planctomycetaceae bacterium]